MKSPLIAKEPPLSFLQIFSKLATPNEKRLIIFACFIVAMSGTLLLGLPILFKDPKILCLASNEICYEDTACFQDYYIDIETGPKSFSAEFSLICENKQQKIFAITLSFMGIFMGTLASTLILIHPRRRQLFLSMAALVVGFSMLGMIAISNSFSLISVLIFTTNFGWVYINVYSYLYIAENFKGELAGFVTIMYSVVWAVAGTAFAIIGLCTDANWRVYCGITGSLSVFAGVGFLLTKSEKKYEIVKEQEDAGYDQPSLLSYFKDMWPNVQIRTNFLIYAVFWGLNAMVYSMVLVELESLGGNLYINMIICSLLELISTMITGVLSKRFNCSDILRWILTTVAVVFTIFVLCPPSLTSGSVLQVSFFVICLFLIKFVCNSLHIITYLYLPKVFTDKYVGFWMLSSRFYARFILLFVPTISNFMRSFGFHPFCFYGFCWIFCRLLFKFTKEVQTEGVDDLLNEAMVTDFERLSVITGSFANGVILHDDHLVNIKVDGIPLSVVRRAKQDGECYSFRETSEFLKLRESVLKRSNVMVKGQNKSLFELKEKFVKTQERNYN